MKIVNILGTEYTIEVKNFNDDKDFAEGSVCGYCDPEMHQIVLCDMNTWPDWEETTPEKRDRAMKRNLRHEIIHAFMNESGLRDCAAAPDIGWAHFEEMVDWWAHQGPKVYAAWGAAGALD